MYGATILLVDDNEVIRSRLSAVLTQEGFVVTAAASALEALTLVRAESYDVLLTDLDMSGDSDGLTLVSAMRDKNPDGVTMLLSSFAEMDAATLAILSQADTILLKPTEVTALVDAIVKRLSYAAHRTSASQSVESVANILERSTGECIDEWFHRVQMSSKLTTVALTRAERCSHLPRVFRDLVERLNASRPAGVEGAFSAAAAAHGRSRRQDGYTPSMLVEESRMLEVTIFHTLQRNAANINFSILLNEVMKIADEVDAQLRQAMDCYVDEWHG